MTIPPSLPAIPLLAPAAEPPVVTTPFTAPSPPAAVPLAWLLEAGSLPMRLRALRELGKIDTPSEAARAAYASRQGLHLLMMQDSDGTWPGGMLTVPKGNALEGVGTIPAYRRLIELGWDPESPALACAKRLLFRLLAEDDDASFLAELLPADGDEEMIRRGRLILREAAAAALAQAGYENDPRLRGAARRLGDRVGAYLRTPLAAKPWIRVGNQHVLPPEAHPPSFHTLIMLAHMPGFRSEHHELMDRLYAFLAAPWPRQHAVQQVGHAIVEQPHLVLGDLLPTRNAMDADLPSALAWLEIMARLGFLKRHEGWNRMLDRMLDDRDRKGIWHAPRSVEMPSTVPAWAWPSMSLGDASDLGALSADVTFRLCTVARLAGRPLELI